MTTKLPSGFEIAEFSDLKYEGMTVEIQYKGVPVAQLNMDKGKDTMELEIPSRFSPDRTSFVFPLEDFQEALCNAKLILATFDDPTESVNS